MKLIWKTGLKTCVCKSARYHCNNTHHMKLIPLLLLLLLPLVSAAQSRDYVERMANAIYRAEGGTKTRYPYGVKSINPPANLKTRVELELWARRITINSIRNNWRRWEQAGKPGEFVPFMARRWCPPSADPIGHRNWVRNVSALIDI